MKKPLGWEVKRLQETQPSPVHLFFSTWTYHDLDDWDTVKRAFHSRFTVQSYLPNYTCSCGSGRISLRHCIVHVSRSQSGTCTGNHCSATGNWSCYYCRNWKWLKKRKRRFARKLITKKKSSPSDRMAPQYWINPVLHHAWVKTDIPG